MGRRTLLVIVTLIIVVLLVLVVIGNVSASHTNPPVTYTVNWDSPETEKLARAACFDCHSNETRWPWYSFVFPMSSLVTNHVYEGREKMNFSTGGELEGSEMIEKIENGQMPLANYVMLHPEANLSTDQKAQLIAGLRATFGADEGGGEAGAGGESGESDESGESGEGGEAGAGGDSGEPATTPESPGG